MWPLAKIVELIPGKDGVVRTARVKTQHGILLRPIQRLYPLEISSADEVDIVSNKLFEVSLVPRVVDSQRLETASEKVKPVDLVTTRLGRKVTKPKRLED
jgi:Family of unknown function (DUF5641)